MIGLYMGVFKPIMHHCRGMHCFECTRAKLAEGYRNIAIWLAC